MALYRDPYARLRELAGGDRYETAAPSEEDLALAQRQAQANQLSESEKALKLGLTQLKSSGVSARGLLRVGVGDEAGGVRDFERAQAMNEDAAAYGPRVHSLDDIEGVGDALAFARNTVLTQTPIIGSMAATGIVGGAARVGLARGLGARAQQTLARDMAGRVASNRAARQGLDEIDVSRGLQDRALRRVKRATAPDPARRAAQFEQGARVGATAAGVGLQAGMAPEIVLDPEGEGTVRERAGKAAVGALATGALEALPVMALLRRYGLTGAQEAVTGGVMARMAKQGAKQGAAEGLTEVAQTAGEKLTHKWVNENVEVMGPDAYSDYINAMAAGAIAGSVFGAPAGIRGIGKDSPAGKRFADNFRSYTERLRQPVGGAPAAEPVETGGFDLNDIKQRVSQAAGSVGEGVKKATDSVTKTFEDNLSKLRGQADIDHSIDEFLEAKPFAIKDLGSGMTMLNEGAGADKFKALVNPDTAKTLIGAGVDQHTAVIVSMLGDTDVAHQLMREEMGNVDPEQLRGKPLAEQMKLLKEARGGVITEVRRAMLGEDPADLDDAKISRFQDLLPQDKRADFNVMVATSRALAENLEGLQTAQPLGPDAVGIEGVREDAETGETTETGADGAAGIDFETAQGMEQREGQADEPLYNSDAVVEAWKQNEGKPIPQGTPKNTMILTDAKGTRRGLSGRTIGRAIIEMREAMPEMRNAPMPVQLAQVLANFSMKGYQIESDSLRPMELGKGWMLSASHVAALRNSEKQGGPKIETTPPARRSERELNKEYGASDYAEQSRDESEREGEPRLAPVKGGIPQPLRVNSERESDTRAKRIGQAEASTDKARAAFDALLMERTNTTAIKSEAERKALYTKLKEAHDPAFGAIRDAGMRLVDARKAEADARAPKKTDKKVVAERGRVSEAATADSGEVDTDTLKAEREASKDPELDDLLAKHTGARPSDYDDRVARWKTARDKLRAIARGEDADGARALVGKDVPDNRLRATAATEARRQLRALRTAADQYVERSTTQAVTALNKARKAWTAAWEKLTADQRAAIGNLLGLSPLNQKSLRAHVNNMANRARDALLARDEMAPIANALVRLRKAEYRYDQSGLNERADANENAARARPELAPKDPVVKSRGRSDVREKKFVPVEDAKPAEKPAVAKAPQSGGPALARAMREQSKNPYVAKDSTKAKKATAYIGDGASGSSTRLYNTLAKELGMLKTQFTSNDTVFVSVNGARAGRVAPVDSNGALTAPYKALDAAIEAGATIITDSRPDRARGYNVGERQIAEYLAANGYVENGKFGVWNKPSSDSAVEESPDFSPNHDPDTLLGEITKYVGARSRSALYAMYGKVQAAKMSKAARDALMRKIDAALTGINKALKAAGQAEGSVNDRRTIDAGTYNDRYDALSKASNLKTALQAVLPLADKKQATMIQALLDSGAVDGVAFSTEEGMLHSGMVTGSHTNVPSRKEGRQLESTVVLTFSYEGVRVEGKNRDAINVLLHEATHAATSWAEQHNPQLQKDMVRLLEHARRRAVDFGLDVDGLYGLGETQEFIAEAFSDPRFQRLLMQMPAANTKSFKNLWEEFKDIVRRALGLSTSAQATALDEVLTLGMQMAKETAAAREAVYNNVLGAEPEVSGAGAGGDGGGNLMSVTTNPNGGGAPTDYMSLLKPHERLALNAAFRRAEVIRQIEAVLPASRHAELRSADLGPYLLVNTGIALALQGKLDLTYDANTFMGVVQGLWEIISSAMQIPSKTAYAREALRQLQGGAAPAAVDSQAALLGPTALKVTRVIQSRIKPAYDSLVRDIDKRLRSEGIPALVQLSTLISQRTGEFRADGTASFNERKVAELNKKLEAYFRVVEGWDDTRKAAAVAELQRKTDNPSADALAVRAFYEDMFGYLRDSGLKFNKITDYFPVAMDPAKVLAGREQLVALLAEFGDAIRRKEIAHVQAQIDEIEGFGSKMTKEQKARASLLKGRIKNIEKMTAEELAADMYEASSRRLGDTHVGGITFGEGDHDPAFRPLNSRMMDFIYNEGTPEQIARFAEFQDSNLDRITVHYVNRGVRRAEWSRLKVGDQIKALLTKAAAQGATPEQLALAKDYVDMQMGSYGTDWHPLIKRIADSFGKTLPPFEKMQRLNNALIAYQNLRLLPLALMSSFIDPLGVAVRDGGSTRVFGAYRDAVKAFRDANGATALGALARDMGLVQRMASMEILTQVYGGLSDPTGTSAKVNAMLFKLNGLEYMTRFSRLAALAAGSRFLLHHKNSPGEHSARYLEELGLTPADIEAGADGYVALNPKVEAALNRFVNESVIRLTPGQRPGWQNDPHFRLAAQYKGYLYGFYNTVVRRIGVEIGEGNWKVITPALMYIPVSIMGEVMRDALQGDDEERTAEDYLALGVERSGLLGPVHGQIEDVRKNAQYGNLLGGTLGGPTGQQLTKMYDTMIGETSVSNTALDALPGAVLYKEWGN